VSKKVLQSTISQIDRGCKVRERIPDDKAAFWRRNGRYGAVEFGILHTGFGMLMINRNAKDFALS